MTTRERFQNLYDQGRALLLPSQIEKRELTADENSNWEKLRPQIEASRRELESATRGVSDFERYNAASHFASNIVAGGGAADPIFNGKNLADLTTAANFMRNGTGAEAMKARKLFNSWMRTGDRELFTITSGSDSGAFIPTVVEVPFVVRRMWNVFLQALAVTGRDVISTGSQTNDIVVPTLDDSSVTGDAPAENATTDTAADPTLNLATLPATLYSSKSIWLSNTVINAPGYDLVSRLLPLLQRRVDLEMDSVWTAAAIASASTANTYTAAASEAITYVDLNAWYHTLSVPYRSDAVFMLADATIAAIERLEDDNHRPLLNLFDPIQMPGVRSLFGRPVIPGLNFPSMSAGAVTGVFASAEAILVRLCDNRLARYVDVPTFPDQVGLRQFTNGSGQIVGAGAAYLKMAAS